MHLYLNTGKFECRYDEDRTDGSLLWENHCHGEFEIIYVLDSGIDLVYEGRGYRCEKGQLIILPPLTYHSVTVDKNTDYKRIRIFFGAGSYAPSIENALVENIEKCPVFSSPTLARIMTDLRNALTSNNVNDYVPLIESLIVQTIYLCADEIERESIGKPRNTTLDSAISYIDEHICEKILLDELAASLFISKSTLCHIFTEQMQISPKQYILQKKMAYASMLIDSGTAMTNAARTVGYENYSNFYRVYKKFKDSSNI